MSKKEKSKKIKTFDSFEEDELLDATEQFNNDNAKTEFDFDDLSSDNSNSTSSSNSSSRLRAIKTFKDNASSALSSVSYDPYDDSEGEDKSGERYQSDLSNLSSGISDGVKRVNDILDTMKKNDLSKSRDEREAIKKGLSNANVRSNDVSPIEKTDRHSIGDKKTLSEAGTNKERAEKNKAILDEAFELPEKKKSLSDRLLNFKDKEVAKAKAKKDAVKNKGLLNSLVEKIGGASSKSVMGLLLKWTLIVNLIIFFFTLFIAVIFYFSNNYTRDPNNNLDSKRLDTRALRAIYALKETDALNDFYGELIASSNGATQTRYKKNLSRLVPSNDLEKLRAGEDPDEAYILQDSSNWYLLYLERLSYAYGGYLDWEPEYLDYGAFADTTMRNASGASVERWREIATKAGEENGIDPNILLAVVDIESGGNPHAKNGSHWGLGQIGEGIFKSYFTPNDRFYNWTDDMRCPTDTGSCDLDDKNHKDNAEMQFTYIARRLSHQMGMFLLKNKGVSLSNASMQDKQAAIAFAVCGYNQGEDRILALYKEYGDAIFNEDGSNYANKFLAHVDTPLKYKGYKMIGANQANYLKLFYKFYNYYSGNTTITNAKTDVTSWYKVSDIDASKNKNNGKYPGPVTEQVKLSYGSTETDSVNEIKTIYYEGLIRDIVKQYNNQMSAFNNYYLANYPDKFITDRAGNLIPELYAKDEYGMDIKSNVIKYQSYIHTIVDKVTNYNTKKTYHSSSAKEDYALLKKDLENEVNDLATKNIHEEYKEPLSDIEDDLAINRYEMSFEVIRTVDSNNEMLSNDEAIDTIEKSLSYSVPIYEYVTLDENKAYKSFFDYEIYNANNYNPDFTLKINDSKFRNHIKGINNINISMKSFVKNGYSLQGEQSVAKRMNDAFNFMYLNNDKAYNPSNHYAEVPKNLNNYYYISRDEVYDRMVEKTKAVEMYQSSGSSGAGTGPNQTIEWTTVSSDNGVSYDYMGLDTTVVRDYYLSNLKPSTYTALKYIATFDYVSQETGDREVDARNPEVEIKKGTIYTITEDEDGNKTKTKSGEIYKKTITRNNVYELEKLRNETIKTRGLN